MCALYQHTATISKPPETVIWKYFQRRYFDSLIRDGSLFFRRVIDFATQDDPFEGTITCIDQKKGRMNALSNPHLDLRSLREWVDMAEGIDIAGMRHSAVINSWTMNDHEVNHMWRIYAQAFGRRHGVAIKSTIGQLHKAIESAPEEICGTAVRYIDYKKEAFYRKGEYEHSMENLMVPIVHKHLQGFSDEREYRLIHQTAEGGDPNSWWTGYKGCRGHNVKIDLSDLISEVVLSPNASENHRKQVERLCRRKCIWTPVRHSQRSPLTICD